MATRKIAAAPAASKHTNPDVKNEGVEECEMHLGFADDLLTGTHNEHKIAGARALIEKSRAILCRLIAEEQGS